MNEKYRMNFPQVRTQSPVSFALSWLLTGVVTVPCLVLVLLSRRLVEPFATMFQAIGVELPWPTRLLLATRVWFLPVLYAVLAALAIVNQLSDRDFRAKRLATVRIFLAAFVSCGLLIFILYLPLLTIASKLQNSK